MARIADRLRLIRVAYSAKISQAQFARLCGISPSTWNNAETGDNKLGLESAIKLARTTGASLDYIYLGKPATLPHALAAAIFKLERRGKGRQ